MSVVDNNFSCSRRKTNYDQQNKNRAVAALFIAIDPPAGLSILEMFQCNSTSYIPCAEVDLMSSRDL